ncbi:MAG: acyl-CoA dehydrogenase family protein [Mobilicoccus sp.]|nr:acyl-CoA dehydrogenase family protein [Mobilicoccus sp.]
MTDEQKALRDAVRGALGRHASPAAERNVSAAPPALDEAVWSALAEVGVPALPWSEEDGGVGAGVADVAVVAAELGRARVQVPLAEVVAAGAMIRACAPGARRAELLGAISEGAVVVPALAEPMRAWSPRPHDVTATANGEQWQLSGTKAPVRYAPAATHLLVTAATDAGTGLFLVSEPGADSEQVEFDRRDADLLAQGEEADAAIAAGLAVGGAVLCSEAVGAMDAALRMTTEYLKTREQFGRPLAAFQTLTQRAADMYAQVELARSAALFAALVADDEQVGVDDILRARVVVDKAGRHVGREAIQLHGGIGVTAEYPVGHLTARLGDISRTWGDTRHHLRDLGSRIGDHGRVEVLS